MDTSNISEEQDKTGEGGRPQAKDTSSEVSSDAREREATTARSVRSDLKSSERATTSTASKVFLETVNRSWSCRQFVVLIFSIGAVVLAYFDPSFRPTFGNLVNIAMGAIKSSC